MRFRVQGTCVRDSPAPLTLPLLSCCSARLPLLCCMSPLIERLMAEDEAEARKRLKAAAVITNQMVCSVILNLRSAGIPYLVAPYEADAQLAFLSRERIVDFVVAEDADLIVFGVQRILLKLKRSPDVEADLFDADRMRGDWQDPDFLRKVCILSVCDYLPNLPGVGLQTAINFLRQIRGSNRYSDHAFPRFLKQLPVTLNRRSIRVTKEYIIGFVAAEFCFKHQLVYCPIRCHFVPLTPYPRPDASSPDAEPPEDDSEVLILSVVAHAGVAAHSSSPSSTCSSSAASISCLPSSQSPQRKASCDGWEGEGSINSSSSSSSSGSTGCSCGINEGCMIAAAELEARRLCGSRLACPQLEYQHSLGNLLMSCISGSSRDGEEVYANASTFEMPAGVASVADGEAELTSDRLVTHQFTEAPAIHPVAPSSGERSGCLPQPSARGSCLRTLAAVRESRRRWRRRGRSSGSRISQH